MPTAALLRPQQWRVSNAKTCRMRRLHLYKNDVSTWCLLTMRPARPARGGHGPTEIPLLLGGGGKVLVEALKV